MKTPIRRRPRLTPAKVRMAAEIRDVLRARGGWAHRDEVIRAILSRRAISAEAAEKKRQELLAAFELHHNPAPETGAENLFDLPFGPDSHRWALERETRLTERF